MAQERNEQRWRDEQSYGGDGEAYRRGDDRGYRAREGQYGPAEYGGGRERSTQEEYRGRGQRGGGEEYGRADYGQIEYGRGSSGGRESRSGGEDYRRPDYGQTEYGRGSYASGGYGAGSYGSSWSEQSRGQYGGGELGRQRGSYGQAYGSYGQSSPGRREDNDRGFIDRAADEVSSWFGDDDAQRRREVDKYRGKGPKNYSRSDERIREDVCDRLSEDPRVDASEIEVMVASGEVTLSGTVASREQRRRAEDDAESVSGVKHVQNNVRVQDASRGGTLGSTI
jgi:osmotically-inducible protein OsmY